MIKNHTVLILFLCFIFQIQAQSQYKEFKITAIPKSLDIEEALSEYLKFESVSGNEKEAGEWLKSLCEKSGLHIMQMGDSNGKYNFAASLYPLSTNLPNIILLNHIDVIPSGDITKWEHPPFSGDITDTEIWGRGAFDNKGNGMMHLFSMIEIVKKFGHKKMPYNVTLLAVSCEESQCNGGAEYVLEHHLKDLNPIVVLGEGPPGFPGVLQSKPEQYLFGVSITNKRPLWLELSLKVTTSAHGSITPVNYANKNMIKALDNLVDQKQRMVFNNTNINILKQLGKLEGGLKGLVLKHPRLFKSILSSHLREKPELFSIFSNSITLTSVDSHNDVINVIPDEVTALLDCRLLPHQTNEEFIAEIEKQLNNKNIKVKIIQEMPIIPPSDDSSIFFTKIKTALKTNYPKSEVLSVSVPNYNDVSYFRQQGINAFCFTPIELDRNYLKKIHNINERIPRGVLEKGTKTYVDFLTACLED